VEPRPDRGKESRGYILWSFRPRYSATSANYADIKRNAEAGDDAAQAALGEALAWYAKAAAHGNATAQY
jgi:hypothetical protein